MTSVPVLEVTANRVKFKPGKTNISLTWEYKPKNAAIYKVECLFLSDPIQRVYVFNSATNEGTAGHQYLRRVKHILSAGVFNLTLENPKESDIGYYECEFKSMPDSEIKKAKLSLICK